MVIGTFGIPTIALVAPSCRRHHHHHTSTHLLNTTVGVASIRKLNRFLVHVVEISLQTNAIQQLFEALLLRAGIVEGLGERQALMYLPVLENLKDSLHLGRQFAKDGFLSLLVRFDLGSISRFVATQIGQKDDHLVGKVHMVTLFGTREGLLEGGIVSASISSTTGHQITRRLSFVQGSKLSNDTEELVLGSGLAPFGFSDGSFGLDGRLDLGFGRCLCHRVDVWEIVELF